MDARWRHGFKWAGGPVAANLRYYVGPMTYRGLVSDEDPLLKLFVQYTPKVRRGPDGLRTGSTKAESKGGDSKVLALDDEYVTGTDRMRGFLRDDLDADFPSFHAIRAVCDAAGLPQPHIIVGHRRNDGWVLRPHLIWLLDAPVCFTPKGRTAPKALWHRVKRGLTYALLRHGADAGALANPMRVKNPVSPLWSRDVAGDRPYRLTELATCVRMDITPAELEQGRAADLPRSQCVRVDPRAGSNALFLSLREFAGGNVGTRRAQGADIESWRHELVTLAHSLTDDERQAKRTAMRVADWTWQHSEPRPRLDPDELHRRRAEAGRVTAAGQRKASVAAVLAAYQALLTDDERKPTQSAVQASCGLGIATVKRCWRDVLSAASVADEGIRRSVSDKKGARASGTEATAHPAPSNDNGAPAPSTEGLQHRPANWRPGMPATPGMMRKAAMTVSAGVTGDTTRARRMDLYAAWSVLRSSAEALTASTSQDSGSSSASRRAASRG